MPCQAKPRGFTDTKIPWDPDIQNNPCGISTLQSVDGLDVSGEGLCKFHWELLHGQPRVGSVLITQDSTVVTGIAKATRFYGSSLCVCDGGHITVVSDRWASKIAQAVGAEVEQNYGVGGSRLLGAVNNQGWSLTWNHQASRLPITQGDDPFAIRPPSQPLIGLMHGINDVGPYGPQASFPTVFRAALEASVRQLRAGFAYRDTHACFVFLGGGWNPDSNVARGGTSRARASTGSLTWTSSTASFLGGTMTFYALVNGTGLETWRCRAKINGGAYVATVDTSTGYVIGSNQAPVPIVVPGVPAGTGQVVQLDFDTVGTNGFYFLGGTLESQWPPIILIFGQPTLPTMPPSTYPSLTQAQLDGMNASMQAVAALFPSKVIYVDLSPLNAVGSYWHDDLHYSPSGHAKIAELAMTALNNAGGIPTGYTAGAVLDFAGKPDWSSPPGMRSYDNATPKIWFSNSITAGDWKGVAVA